MTTITITISIDAGENARVVVNGNGQAAAYVPPFADELVPLPEGAIALPGDPAQPVQMRRGMATAVLDPDLCPVHHVPWKSVPGGISKKNGKPYDAFRACPERGCDQRPR